MKEILFRGKTRDGKWIESCSVFMRGELALMLNERPIKEVIKDKNGEPVDVIFSFCSVGKNTVGQFTGLTDKNGKKIFEGDIVKTKYGRLCRVVRVSLPSYVGWDLEVFDENNALTTKKPDEYDLYYKDNLEVVGNIFDGVQQ